MTNPQLRTYRVWYSSPEYTKTIVAKSAASARYQYFRNLDFGLSYREVFRNIRSKSMGKFQPSHLEQELEKFNRVKAHRGINFAELGMKIDVNGKMGIIVGGNDSYNLDVIFDGKDYKENCHPHWETTYYGEDGAIIKDYKKQRA